MDVPRFTAHRFDLNATIKIAPHIINLCQNHEIRNAIDKSYQQYSYEPEMKEAWQKLGDFIDMSEKVFLPNISNQK